MRTILLWLLLGTAACAVETRAWTDAQGNRTQAVLRGFDGGDVLLQTADGKTIRVPIKNLSADDQSFVVLNITSLVDSSSPNPGASPVSPTTQVLAKASWPRTHTAPDGLTNADYVEQSSRPGSHVYRSRRFEYVLHAQDKLSAAVMKEVARVFEGTYELLSLSPFGVQAQPLDGYFRAHLYQTMEMYHASGGPRGSAGVYKRAERLFHVPLDSLGVKRGTTGYVRDGNFQLTTLVHEITHMMMHDILPLLPHWFIEGSAEYVECIPYKSGTFRHDDLLSSVTRYNQDRLGGKYRLGGPPLDSIQNIIRAPIPASEREGRVFVQPPTNPVPQIGFYHSSMLLTYYLMHLDGDGKGTRLLRFLEAVRAEQPRYAAFMKEYDVYRAAMDEFLKKPEVKKLPDGRFEYPNYLKAPQLPKPPHDDYLNERVGHIHMNILLDGRSDAELQKQAVEALLKVGLKATP